MKPIHIALIMISSTFGGTVMSAETLMSEQVWDACRNEVAASTPKDMQGANGGGLLAAIHEKCGPRPVVKTKTGYALLKNDCDDAYENALEACRYMQPDACGAGASGLPQAGRSWIVILSPLAFREDQFNLLCLKVCQTKRMPSRELFGQKVCGGV